MVHTRHSNVVDEGESDTFVTLQTRRTRLSRDLNAVQDENSDDSGVVQFRESRRKPGRPSGSGRKSPLSDTSPVSKRSPRAAAKRVSYVEDCIDEGLHNRRVGGVSRPSRRLIIEDEIDEDNESKSYNIEGTMSGEDEPVQHTRVTGRGAHFRKDRLSPVFIERPQRRRRTADYLVSHPSPRQLKREQLEHIEDAGIRRSSRRRNPVRITEDYTPIVDTRKKRQRSDDTENEADTEDAEGFPDIYSRVKRKRACVKRDMYGMPVESENNEEEEDDDNDDDNDDEVNDDDENEEDKSESEDEEKQSNHSNGGRRGYFLRENKPRTQHYNSSLYVRERQPRSQSRFFNDETPHSPARRKRPKLPTYMSPARRQVRGSRRRAAFHGSSSTSSSSSSSSSDEEKFQRRKAKSMLKSRQRCLPMNFDPDDINKNNVLRDRQKIGSSLADVDPMTIDRSITFESVGGLGKHIRALKEMVVFPLLYPEIFERFKVSPPRGVLFYGPPGTGKTLVARALANECSSDDRRVAFYMRKGADCLSKWVGESERQLRLLFDQAYQTRPSIIFFDEIDGLAPVRSSRQDQIHSSIVSTLLALMDGLDSRGEVVVIGATNRIDSIDPALRRPGRFDREFLFPLPSIQARSQILKIHTKEWNPRLNDKFVSEVAERCLGYCGADMKALCTEAALLALRRRYPQIYTSSEKLQIDVSSIHIGARDFVHGIQNLIPTSQRSVCSPARSLSAQIAPLLNTLFTETMKTLNEIFPSVLSQLSNLDAPVSDIAATGPDNLVDTEMMEEEDTMAIYEHKVDKRRKLSNIPTKQENFLSFTSYASHTPSTCRPRLLLSGTNDQGQSSHIGPAILHELEQLPVHVLDLTTLYAVSANTPEESCAQIFREACRTAPSIIYLPHINQWWNVIGETIRTTLLTLILNLDPSSPLLLLATSEESYSDLDYTLQDVFDEYCNEVVVMRNPSSEERRGYYTDLLLNQATQPPPQRKQIDEKSLEVLPKAPPPEPRQLTEQEKKKLYKHEEETLIELRLFLRDVLNKLGRDRKFFIFTKPVDIEDVPDYHEIIKSPMDLSTMMSKIDLHHYQVVKDFITDIEQICLNALEYNPDKDAQSRVIRHRACALKDTAYAIIKTELDPEFEKLCESIVASRKQRGEDSTKTAPSFYHTRPLNQGPMHPLAVTKHTPETSTSQVIRDANLRSSRRLHGAQVVEVPSLEEVERIARAVRSDTKLKMSPNKENSNNVTPQLQVKKQTPTSKNSSGLKVKTQETGSGNKSSNKKLIHRTSTSSTKKPVKKSIWGRSSYVKRKRRNHWHRRKVEKVENEELENDEEGKDEEDGEEMSEGENVSSEEEMETDQVEVKSPKQTVNSQTKSPKQGKSPRQEDNRLDKNTNSEKGAEQEKTKSDSVDSSFSKCLSVDVNLRSPKDNQKSPSHKSPRGETLQSVAQKSPVMDTRSHSPRSYQEPSQKSPRHRNTSGQRSPRSHDTSHLTSGHKSPKNAVITPNKTPDRLSNKLSPRVSTIVVHDENSNQATPTPQGPGGDCRVAGPDVVIGPDGAQTIVNGFVDSGIGSSESNGDSNDSAGKLTTSSENSEMTTNSTQETEAVPTEGTDHTLVDVDMEDKQGESPKLRMTRSRNQTKVSQETSVSTTNPMIVDRDRLVRLLDLTVILTEDYNIGKLEKLYSIYAQCIYQHRLDCDKTHMTQMMEKRLQQYTSNVAEKMRAEKARTRNIQLGV